MVRITIATFLRHIINRLNFATSSDSGTKQALKIYIMSDVKTFMFPDSGTRSGGLDPNALLAMMNNGGGFGANGNWIWVIFLFFLYGWNRNGLFGGNGGGSVAGTAERDLLMSAIQGNGNAISQLATTLNCDVNSIKTAICSVQSAIQGVGNQVGLTGQQVINAIQAGNTSLASQLSKCCCDNQLAICNQTNALQNAINYVATGQERGFSNVAYETQAQTCAIQQGMANGVQTLKDTGNANTQAIIAKLDAMENAAMQDKIAGQASEIATLKAQISQEHQNATFASMLAPMQSELNAIKSAMPATVTVPNPQGVLMPSCVAWQYGIGQQNGFWG